MYYQRIAIAITAFALAATVLDASRRNWTAEAREPFYYTFSNDKSLDVDNVDGTIQVVATPETPSGSRGNGSFAGQTSRRSTVPNAT